MAWPRVGQGGRSGTSAIRTAPPWTELTKLMNEQNNERGTYEIETNYYETLMEHYEDYRDDDPTLVIISGEQTATPEKLEETVMIADGETTFAQYVRYEKWLAWKQKDESDNHAAADGRIPNSQKMPGVATTATTETPAMPATK